MERDFLGLSSNEPWTVAKEEINIDGLKEIGFTRGVGMQWPFSNKVSALPHLMPFKVAQEDRTKMIMSDSMLFSGFMSSSCTNANDHSKKHSMTEIQKPLNLERQAGNHLSVTTLQHDMLSGHEKMFPASNKALSISLGSPFFKNQYATTANIINSTMKPQLFEGIPLTAPNFKSGSPAQLTIFYGGAVNVYNDIPPEKAQAIMLLAGNGSSISSNMAEPIFQVHSPSSMPVPVDISHVNRSIATPPCSRLSSPISVSSRTDAQSGSGSTSTEEIIAAKTTVATTPGSKLEPPKVTCAIGSVAVTTMIPSVPQARKVSLARFLEKRKERVMSAAPYNINKKSQELSAADAEGVYFYATSGAWNGSLKAKQGE